MPKRLIASMDILSLNQVFIAVKTGKFTEFADLVQMQGRQRIIMANLRPYQLEALEAIYNEMFQSQTALCVLPTGSGKTEVMIGLLKKSMEVKPDFKAAILMGRIDLVTQTEKRFCRSLGVKHVGVYCGSLQRREMSRALTVASIQSADVKKFPLLNMIIVDEVHRLDQDGGAYARFIEEASLRNPRIKIVGFTATAFRSNGLIYGDDMLFKKVVYKKTIKEMIAMGFLCEPKMKGSACAFDISNLRIRAGEYRQEDIDELVNNKETVLEQVKDALSRMADRKSVFWACANIEHCNRVADVLMSLGESVTTVHSKLNKSTRDANLSTFMTGMVRHVSFVSVLSEGFDHPPGDCLVLMRPTRSPVLYVQTCGRVLRPSPATDKLDALILDYGQVIKTLGPLDDPFVKGRRSSSEEGGDAPVKECPDCFTMVFAGVRQCPDCGHEFPYTPPAAKLEKQADTQTSILSQAPRPEKVTCTEACISMHESRAGNLCVKIVYYEDRNSILKRGIPEFYVTTSVWAMERLDRRLGEIEAELPSVPFEGEIWIDSKFEVMKTFDGKYEKILSVKRLPNDPEPDTSFDFGFNANSPEEIGFK